MNSRIIMKTRLAQGFVSEFSDLQIAKDLSKLQDQISYEQEADYLWRILSVFRRIWIV